MPSRSECRRGRWFRLVACAWLALDAQQHASVCHGFSRGPIFASGQRSRLGAVSHPLLRNSHSTNAITIPLWSSRRNDDLITESQPGADVPDKSDPSEMKPPQSILESFSAYFYAIRHRRLPPPQVEDVDVLFYDIFLILNLSVSISFWVVHRMDVSYIGTAFNEGCLMCLLWITSGLSTGAFLNSAVDGHFGSASEQGGPKAAAMLAFHTFLNAVNLRLLFALLVAVVQHRPVGEAAGEQLMPLELAFGWSLMIFWRSVHSSFVPRM